jgi:hypothetical protein
MFSFSDSARQAYTALDNMLRAYFKLVIVYLYGSDSQWKTKLYSWLLKYRSANPVVYDPLLKSIQSSGGVEYYDFAQLDITAMSNILLYCYDLYFFAPKSANAEVFYHILKTLTQDRNDFIHEGTPTKPNEWFLNWSLSTMHDMEVFFDAFEKRVDSFKREYKSLFDQFLEEQRCSVSTTRERIQKDFSEITEIKNLGILLGQLQNKHFDIDMFIIKHLWPYYRGLCENKKDWSLYVRFWISAADNGISVACSMVGDLFYDNKGMYGLEQDYRKAASYYEKVKSISGNLDSETQCKLASIYINKCAPGHSTDEGFEIIASLKKRGFTIGEQPRSPDFIEYFIIEKPKKPDLIQQQNEAYEAVKKTLEFWDKNNSNGNTQKG